eukprot:6208422-Pleurochrysis_carterae.AAC.1
MPTRAPSRKILSSERTSRECGPARGSGLFLGLNVTSARVCMRGNTCVISCARAGKWRWAQATHAHARAHEHVPAHCYAR